MSGECDRCGEHCLECACNLDDKVEIREFPITIHPVDIVDGIDHIQGLLNCLGLAVSSNDFKAMSDPCHHDLLMVIREKLDTIKTNIYHLERK